MIFKERRGGVGRREKEKETSNESVRVGRVDERLEKQLGSIFRGCERIELCEYGFVCGEALVCATHSHQTPAGLCHLPPLGSWSPLPLPPFPLLSLPQACQRHPSQLD